MRGLFVAIAVLSAVPLAPGDPGPVRSGRFPPPPSYGPWASSSEGTSVTLEWYRATLGPHIGRSGIAAVDIDSDGVVEIVAGGGGSLVEGNLWWYVLSRRGDGYDQEWGSLPLAAPFKALRVAQLDPDPPLEVLVASGSRVFVYDGASRVLRRTLSTPSAGIVALEVADLEGDGTVEIVVADAADTLVLDAATGALRHRAAGVAGTDLAIGQVDDDPAMEIVVANGYSAGHVLDGASLGVEWAEPSGFGRFVDLGDVDADGRDEIVAAFDWRKAVVWDGDTRVARNECATWNGNDIGAMRVADVDGDATPEIIVGPGQWGNVQVFDGATCGERFSLPNPEPHVYGIAVAELDGDAGREVVWGVGSGGPNRIHVVDAATLLPEWRSASETPPFYGLDHGDVDGDGVPELLYVSRSSESEQGDGLLFVHDAVSRVLEYQSPQRPEYDEHGMNRVGMADIDQDPQREIFLTSSHVYEGLLLAIDGVTHEEQWRAEAEKGTYYVSLQVGDVDGDGASEIVLGTRGVAGGTGRTVHVLDAATGSLEWRSPVLFVPGSHSLLRLANLDDDPALEIVAGGYRYGVSALDPVEQTVLFSVPLAATALHTADRDGDGTAEILVGTQTGDVVVLDSHTGAVVKSLGHHGGRIDGLGCVELNGFAPPEIVMTVGGRLRVAEGGSGTLALQTDVLGESAGANDGLLVADVDEDGRAEVFLGNGTAGVILLELLPGYDAAPPSVTLTAPAAGAVVGGIVTVKAAATDDWGVDRVELWVDGERAQSDEDAPFEIAWDTLVTRLGGHRLEARAFDGAGREARSVQVTVSVADTGGQAVHDHGWRTAACASARACDSGDLLFGRWMLGPEWWEPNTLAASCPDGGWGQYRLHGSSEALRVATLDGTVLAEGKRVRIQATVYSGPRATWVTRGSKKRRTASWWLDIFAAADAAAPKWTKLTTVTLAPRSLQAVAVDYTLPAGRMQAVRAQVRYFGRAVPCEWGPWNDHDDLVFTVRPEGGSPGSR